MRPVPSDTRVLLLQHPREQFMPIGTARMAAASLPDSQLVVGTEVDNHPAVVAALSDPSRPAILLWPGPGAKDLAQEPPEGPVTLVVVDGTWSLAKKLVRINPRVASLPRYALSPSEPSRYRIRGEPQEDYVSTIEAVMLALEILDRAPGKFRALLEPFEKMVDTQIEHEKLLHGGRQRKLVKKPRRPRPVPRELEGARSVVVISTEANAWPRRFGNPPEDELVHLLATRMDDDARFESIIAPSNVLAPGTLRYTRLSEATLAAGGSKEDFLARWREFIREDDVLCAWGYYGVALLAKMGAALPRTVVDLRPATARYFGDKPSTPEDLAPRVDAEGQTLGLGRGGERLAIARAMTEVLMRRRSPRGPVLGSARS